MAFKSWWKVMMMRVVMMTIKMLLKLNTLMKLMMMRVVMVA